MSDLLVRDIIIWLKQFPPNYILYTDIDGIIGVYNPQNENECYTISSHYGGKHATNLGDDKDE